jgi:hypothetical protein
MADTRAPAEEVARVPSVPMGSCGGAMGEKRRGSYALIPS